MTDRSAQEDDHDGGFAGAPVLADPDEDDGYVSPEFDLPTASESEDEPAPPPAKRAKAEPSKKSKGGKSKLAEDEELALQLIRGRR